MITAIATLTAVGISQLILPAINNITGKELELFSEGTFKTILALLATIVCIGLIAGFYPAIYLSSFQPVKVIKSNSGGFAGRFSLRKVLVIVQFSISIILIVAALIISKQVDYIQSAKLGLNKDEVLYIPEIGDLSRPEKQTLKSLIADIPGVKKIAFTDGVVGGQNWANSIRAKGSDNSQLVNFLNIDHDYLDLHDIKLKAGRGFSTQFPGDTLDGILLNETAIKQLGISEPAVGQQVVWAEDEDTTYYATVVGVVKDFHYTSLRSEIKPFAFVTDLNRQNYFAVKLDAKNIRSTMDQIEKVWNKQVPRPFQYFFLDDTYNKLYTAERNFKTVFLYVTILAILIACLGLFGLVSFITIQRTKEIGIRKVLGASVSGIVALLSKDFLKLVILSALIAFPVAWYAVSKWLQDFAYRVNINWWVFLLSGLLAVVIALITISIQAMRAAIANPVKSLRSE